MLVISRKIGQKIMINDNIVITIADIKSGQCRIAIEADKDVKIYREEIYYQIKLANLVGKETDANAVDSVSNLLKKENVQLNDKVTSETQDMDVEIKNNEKAKKIIIRKQDPNN